MSKYKIWVGKFGELSTIEKDGVPMLDVIGVDIKIGVGKLSTMVITTQPEDVELLVDEEVHAEEGQIPNAS